MHRILLPVDHSEERAHSQVTYVKSLPDVGNSVEVKILHVFGNEDSIDPKTDESARDPEKIPSVARTKAALEDAGIECEVIKDRHDVVSAIVEQATEHDVDAIVLGGRKRSTAGKVLFGSVTMAVLRNMAIPVVVTGELEE